MLVYGLWVSLAFLPHFKITIPFYLYFPDHGWKMEMTAVAINRKGK
jgi:hypothetical protein